MNTVNGPQVAVRPGPFIPDAYATLLQPFCIVVAPQKPQEFNKNTLGMQFFGGNQREPLRQIETHLVAENRACACAGAVGFQCAVFIHVAHEIFVLLHSDYCDEVSGLAWSSTVTAWVISAVFANMAEAEQYFSCDSRTALSTAAWGRLRPLTVKSK